VAVATLKKDGMFFLAGLTAGIFVFGENIDGLFANFWNSSNLGRFTLPELFDVPIGVVVFGVVLMAIILFGVVEFVEDQINQTKRHRFVHRKQKLIGAAILAGFAFIVMIIGQPTVEQKWEWMSEVEQARIDNREVQIAPAEMLDFIENDLVRTVLLDVRKDSDFNLFHIVDAQHVQLDELSEMTQNEFLRSPSNTLFVVMSNDEANATEAWKVMRAESIQNVYILEGGVNGWLDAFSDLVHEKEYPGYASTIQAMDKGTHNNDELRYSFQAALGSNYAVADPVIHDYEFEYTPKVKMKVKKATGGG